MKKSALGLLLLLVLLAVGAYLWTTDSRSTSDSFTASDDQAQLPVVVEGSRNAVAAIQSGKGQVTRRSWSRMNDGGVRETETKHQIAFSGDKFRLSSVTKYLQNTPGIPPEYTGARVWKPDTFRRESSYDGEKTVRLEEDKATISDPNDMKSHSGRSVFQDYREAAVVGVDIGHSKPAHGLMETDKWPHPTLPSSITRSAPRIVGRETLNGDECIIVEIVLTSKYSTRPTWFWLNPTKGFTIPRARGWVQGGDHTEKILSWESDVEVREYGADLWGPAKVSYKQYQLDKETGEYYKTIDEVTTFADDFQINVPVSEAELTLTLPSGTKVTDELLKETYTVP